MLRVITSLALILVASFAYAVVRDFTIEWEQPLLDVDGNSIEKVDGFRLYTSDGVFIQTLPGDARKATVRINVAWGQTCFKMRSFYVVSGTEYESADSNVGACKTIQPGKPVPPVVAR